MYLQLGETAHDYLNGKARLIMKIKVSNKDTSVTTKTTTKKAKTLTKGRSVPSINKNSSADIFEDDDLEVSRLHSITDTEDIYDFGSPPPTTKTVGRGKTDQKQNQTVPKKSDSVDVSQLCYNDLLALKEEVGNAAHNVAGLDDHVLQIISAMLPTDLACLKEALDDTLSSEKMDQLRVGYGRRIVEICTKHKMSPVSSSSKKAPASKKFNASDLHAQYDYQGSSSAGASNSRPPTSKTKKPTSKASTYKAAATKSGIRAMPI
ncbi:hypothetical protein M422DRAFT_51876 [Sphaerobolus stellatus SS14]|uniref:Uncharacterized protein n=1 Tax=Sphaerobolus stellatus (strain SS14) TaxID=990650 RepID=A0A0C9UZA1_SPHS4|nr:hypothetical protein M422DRAFT_51876 [Sphaerobolus stellatus SS14]